MNQVGFYYTHEKTFWQKMVLNMTLVPRNITPKADLRHGSDVRILNKNVQGNYKQHR